MRVLLLFAFASSLAAVQLACGGCSADEGVTVDADDGTDVAGDTAATLDTSVLADTALPDVADPKPDTFVEDTLVEDVADTAIEDVADTVDTYVQPPCPWTELNDGLRGGRVGWVGYDGRAQPSVFATTGSLLLRSADDGDNWQLWAESEHRLGALSFIPDDPKGILATSSDGILESYDGGLSFSLKSLQGFGITKLLVHPASPRRVFAGTYGAGILRSSDGAGTWSAFNVGIPLTLISDMAGPSDNPDVVVAATELLNDNLGATNQGTLLRTANGGASWSTVLSGITWGFGVTFCDPTTAYAAVRRGLAKSVDAGLSWTITPGFGTRDAIRVVASADCQRIYVTVYAEGVFRSDDGGDTVVGPLNNGIDLEPSRFNAEAMALDPNDTAHVFLANYGGLYETRDSGASWRLTSVGQGIEGVGFGVSAADSSTLWMASYGAGLWRRDGVEATWERVQSTALPRDFIFMTWANPTDAAQVYVSTIPELWRTRDGGATFENLDVRGNVFGMTLLDTGDLMAVTQGRGILRSTDDGATWTQTNGDLTPWPTVAGNYIDTRTVLGLGDGVVLVGTNGQGILRSEDDGQTWTHVGAGLEESYVVRLARSSSRVDSPVYALVSARGVYRSDDDGLTWTLGTTGLQSLAINDLVADTGSDAIFVSTPTDGIYRSTDARTWVPFDRYCMPVAGAGTMSVYSDADGRWLLGAGGPSRLVRHALTP